MPDIPVSSVLGYFGVASILFSGFLILSGFKILRVEQITVAPGARTWGLGIFLGLVGVALLVLDILLGSSEPPTPAPVAVVVPTSATLPAVAATATLVSPSATPTPTGLSVAREDVQEPAETPTSVPKDTPVFIPTATLTPPPPADETPTPIPPSPLPPSPIPPSPTSLPAPKRELIIEDFESYKNDDWLTESFQINRNAGNEGWVRLSGVPHVNQGQQAMAFEFDIRHASPNNYIGFDREFPAQDWSGYSVLCIWIESDGSNRDLIIQFGESISRFWKKIYTLSQGTGDFCIPLQEQHDINLRTVGYYGVYVQGPPQGQSIIYLDNVRIRE